MTDTTSLTLFAGIVLGAVTSSACWVWFLHRQAAQEQQLRWYREVRKRDEASSISPGSAASKCTIDRDTGRGAMGSSTCCAGSTPAAPETAGPVSSSPNITPPGCGLPEEAANVPQRAGTYGVCDNCGTGLIYPQDARECPACKVPFPRRCIGSGKLKGAILGPLSPAPSPGTGPDAGPDSANSTPGLGNGGGDNL